jgi:hypothetical protein
VHHVYSRDWHRIRFDPRNLVAVCFMCHRGRGGAHDAPVDFVEWFQAYRPDDYAFIRNYENRKPINRSVADLMELREQIKAA